MTGIERLRELARRKGPLVVPSVHGTYCAGYVAATEDMSEQLSVIADQIERELTCDADTIENIRLIVGGVVDEMERRVLGHEGMEDSPVARWARELREALGGEGHDMTDEDREAIAWVREHGGLDHVRSEWSSRVPYDKHEQRRQRLLGHIAECETALGRRNQRIKELGHRVSDLATENAELRKRAMPEGMEWPTVDGKPVVIGERMRSCGIDDCKVVGIDPGNSRLILASDNIEEGKATYFTDFAEYCHRPDPKVLDADGAEIRVGDEVYQMSCKYRVSHLHGANDYVRIVYENSGRWVDPKTLTHERPDSWERLERDANVPTCTYFGATTKDCEICGHVSWECSYDKASDLVRRCRALAERGW